MEAAKTAINNFMGYGTNELTTDERHRNQATSPNTEGTETSTAAAAATTTTDQSAHQSTTTDTSTADKAGQATTSASTGPTSHGPAPSSSSADRPPKSSASSASSDPSEVQSSNQGTDPALVGDPNPNERNTKMTGSGTDGSHSAVFGLTPDGHKHDDTTHGATPVKPAHSQETTVGKAAEKNDTTSRAAASGEVSEQMHKAETDSGKKGLERKDPAPESSSAGTSGKPGAGLTGLQQGGGDIPAK